MSRALALGFGDAWNVVACGFLAVAGTAEDLQITRIIRAAKRSGDDVIDVPELTGIDLGVALLALASCLEEEIETEFC